MEKLLAFVSSIALLSVNMAHSQQILDMNKGNILYTKKGIMDGNLVRTIFFNHGEVAHWPDQPSGEWPKGSGHSYVDGVAMIAQTEVRYNGHIFHPLETRYREFMRYAPDGTPWGWEPLPNYANMTQSSPAMSNNPATWPSHWPDRPSDWDGYWNGFFGKGVQNADLETYFVFDDSQDKQYATQYGYYPIPSDTTRGGLGLQVRNRGFQWSQVLAEDNIFWYYEIQNISQQNYPKTLFAQYVDWGIGGVGGSDFNSGAYDLQLDISYSWSELKTGQPGNWSPVGYAGYAFLESPGISDDEIDNDDDGLTDERRDNDAGVFLTDSTQDRFYTDANKFYRWYGHYWKPHWSGDENQNWRSFTDLNHNGRWDPGEPLNDDVGTDGIGPGDMGYKGPDPDGSEGDGRPEQGEPNFGILDKDESDQLGLTGFNIFPVHVYELHDDEQNWAILTTLTPPSEQVLRGVNLANMFASGLFPLYQAQTERFSMALLFGIDRDDLARRKKTIQQIYNANYQFAKPPDKPILTAIPGDRKVTLYWDDGAEKTFDRFLQEYDFEGYKIYKSTDPNFLEAQVITDAFGKPTFRKPIAQYDKIDGIEGFFPISINGAEFYLGNDHGLRHSYVDTDVQNGQTYYYAVASYDYGYIRTNVAGQLEGIPPSECTTNIKVDANGNVKFVDVNTAVVVPRAPSAGFVPAEIAGQIRHNGPGTGTVQLTVLNPEAVKDNETYQITFNNNGRFNDSPRPTYSLQNLTENVTIQSDVPVSYYGQEIPVFNGVIGYIYNDSVAVVDSTAWKKGNCNYIVKVGFDTRFATTNVNYPADFEIRFYDHVVDTSQHLYFGSPPAKPVNFTVFNLTEGIKAPFLFFDRNNNDQFDVGDEIVIVYGDSAAKMPVSGSPYRTTWSITFYSDTTTPTQIAPSAGDIYFIGTTKPFRTNESFTFTTKGAFIDTSLARSSLDKIAVVPNPYLGAASWEPPLLFQTGRGERRIYFTHLPRVCTIRIYTIRGYLVQTLYHNSSADDGKESWNLLTKDGMDVAYGVYIYEVDAPGIGNKIGKFAVVK
ncbi:MAG: hypothetical protein ACP5ON_10085 [Bacteroidota bacterium]